MNPILDETIYIPDSEARVFDDGYTYIYGSKDIPLNDQYCSRSYDVFRSKDLINWERFPNVFTNKKAHTNQNGYLYAPDCEYINGKYCLFYCMDDGTEGVAFSDYPYGPFDNARPIIGADGDGIDPSIFVDDDGRVYYYWGQMHARGGELDTSTWSLKKETINRYLITDEKEGFHEGSSVRKRNGLYYFVYADISRGRPTCLGYCTSEHPLGPYEKKGIIIDNTGCDPSSWNNHGCIAKIKDQWYVFYHRSTNNSNYSRTACIEKIHFEEDGRILEVQMTTQGAEERLPVNQYLCASRICSIKGDSYLQEFNDGHSRFMFLSNLHDGDVFTYKYETDFSGVTQVEILASKIEENYRVEVVLDDIKVAEIAIDGSCGIYNFQSYRGAWLYRVEKGIRRHKIELKIIGTQDLLGGIKGIQFL